MLMFSTFVEQKLKTFEVLSGTEQRITATVCDEVYEIKAKKVCGTSDRSGNSKQNADVQ